MTPTEISRHPLTAAAMAKIESSAPRGAWSRGVQAYALEMLEMLADRPPTEENLLNGAANWQAYSYGGSSLIWDADICKRLATPGEHAKKRGGDLPPNSRETWLDCQARALRQASALIRRITVRF
jgi:hypothetical protein